MEIIRFRLKALRNEGWFRFHTEFSGLAEDCGLEILRIDRLFPPYKALYAEADILLEVLRKSFITKDTTGANRQRDAQFRGLRDAVKAFLYSLDAPKKDAAEKVSAVIKKYNDAILKGARADKTAAIDNLLQDLTTAPGGVDLTQEVQALGVGGWVVSLDAANAAYKQSLAARVEESTERPEAGRLRQVRIELDHYYVNMVNVVDSLLLSIGQHSPGGEGEGEEEPEGPVEGRDAVPATPDEKIVHFAKALNTCITYYRSLLKRRKTSSSKKEEDESDEPVEG
ncbi:MAG: DUF6261 family protein [Tannerellaceae bacterium]|nr:DUF6261 family protein [Tannerellaceae bacterium]